MSCIEITQPGAPEALKITTRPLPIPGEGEVLIRVEAAGINRPDVLQRQGLYPPPQGASDIPGLEVAGLIVKGAGPWQEGARVCALLTGGGYAEYATAPAEQCLPIPQGLDAIQASALPETFFTVWSNLFERAHLQKGESVLIHGGSSGIGTTAIQLAHAFGARVLTTAGSVDKCNVCVALGADRAINYRVEDFVQVIQDDGGVDVIIDMVGGDYIQRNIDCLKPDGRHVSLAFLKDSQVQVDLMSVLLKRLVLTGSTLRARPVAFKAAIAVALREKVWPLLENGSVRPIIHTTFPLAQASAAHALMESSQHIGKIVLCPEGLPGA